MSNDWMDFCFRQTGRNVALKVIDKNKCAGKEEMVDAEIRLLRSFSHPNIVQFIGDWNSTDLHYIAMEFVEVK